MIFYTFIYTWSAWHNLIIYPVVGDEDNLGSDSSDGDNNDNNDEDDNGPVDFEPDGYVD